MTGRAAVTVAYAELPTHPEIEPLARRRLTWQARSARAGVGRPHPASGFLLKHISPEYHTAAIRMVALVTPCSLSTTRRLLDASLSRARSSR
jgi:hypothetical protein